MPFSTPLFEQKVNVRQEEEEKEGSEEGRCRWWWSRNYIFLPRASYCSKHLTYNSSFNSITINNHEVGTIIIPFYWWEDDTKFS